MLPALARADSTKTFATDGPTVRVHIEADDVVSDVVSLERFDKQDRTWQGVCQSPCDERIAKGGRSRVYMQGMSPSPVFGSGGAKDEVGLHVEIRTRAQETAGIVVLVTGAAVGCVGTGIL